MTRCAAGAIIAAGLLSLAACKTDERSAFEAFQDCNAAIRSAGDEAEALACFTDRARQKIRDERYGDIAPWLEKFRAARPETPRLFREVETEGRVQLLVIEGDGPGYVRHVVQMQRVSGAWRIAGWDSVLMGQRDDPAAPIGVSLDVTGAVEWRGTDLVVRAGGPPRCGINVSHVFGIATINIPARCDLLVEPGEYDAEEFLDPAAGRPIHLSVEGSPNIGVDRSEDAMFTVRAAPAGRISGAFTVEVAHADGDYTVNGSYENIPFPDGADR